MHKALGRGLEALIPAISKEAAAEAEREAVVDINKILPNKNQPRKYFEEARIAELADSIKKHGIAQPLVVKNSVIPGEYDLIAGERRLRAAKKAGLDKVPVVVRNVDEKQRYELSLVENLQREDLNAIEQARAFKAMMDQYGLTQEEISDMLALSRSKVANTLRLLSLSDDIKEMIAGGLIPAGQARSLVGIEDDALRKEIAQRIINEKLTSRDVEKITSDWKHAIGTKKVKIPKRKNPEIKNIEESLQRSLGTKVEITAKKKGGIIKIAYYSHTDMDRILDILHGRKKKK